AMRGEAWFYIRRQTPQHALALLEKALGEELKDTPWLVASDYGWALIFAGQTAQAERQMRIAAYAPQPPSTFLQNALGRKPASRLQAPLDLTYVMIKANKTAEAVKLVAKEAPWACRHAPVPWLGPLYEPHDRAIREAYEAVCPKEAKRAETAE